MKEKYLPEEQICQVSSQSEEKNVRKCQQIKYVLDTVANIS